MSQATKPTDQGGTLAPGLVAPCQPVCVMMCSSSLLLGRQGGTRIVTDGGNTDITRTGPWGEPA